jgi:hypothetical protein
MSQIKAQPYDRTVLIEGVLTLADKQRRNAVMKLSQASAIPITNEFKQGDANISPTSPLFLGNVSTVVVVKSFGSFLVDFEDLTHQRVTGLFCTGTFVFFGELYNVIVSPTLDQPQIRVSYLSA